MDRFKFRVWDRQEKRYLKEFENICLGPDGKLYAGGGDRNHCRSDEAGRYLIEPCTGKKDERGRLIFEGDIIEQYDPLMDAWNRCAVEWSDEGVPCFVCRYLEPDKVVRVCRLASPNGTYFEGGAGCRVVGNIHEKKGGAE